MLYFDSGFFESFIVLHLRLLEVNDVSVVQPCLICDEDEIHSVSPNSFAMSSWADKRFTVRL